MDSSKTEPEAPRKEESVRNYADRKAHASRARTFLQDACARANDAQQGLTQRCASAYMAYRNRPRYRGYSGRAKLAIPELFKSVEQIHARAMRGLFGSGDPIRILPREPGDLEKAQDVSALLAWERERRRFRSAMSMFIKQELIIGTSIAKVHWDFNAPAAFRKKTIEHVFPDVLSETGATVIPEEITEEYIDNAQQGPIFTPIFRDDFLVPDLTCPGLQAEDGQPYVIQCFEVSEPQLRLMSDLGTYSKKAVTKVIKEGKDHETNDKTLNIDSEYAIARMDAIGYNYASKSDKPCVKRFALYELWGEYDLHGDGHMVECVVTMCGDEILRIQRNPFHHQKRPFVASQWIKVTNEFDGIGIIEPVLSLWHELCDTRNQAMDFKSFALNPMLIVGAAANVSDTRFVAGPGRMWHVMNPDAVRPFEFNPAVASLAMGMESAIRENIEDSTGATRLMGGSDPGRIEKATVYTGMVEQASERILEGMENVAWDALSPAMSMFWKLEQQFREEAVVVRVLGKEGTNLKMKSVNPQDMLGDFDIIPVSGQRLSARWQEQQLLLQYMQVFGQQMDNETRMKIGRRVWDAMGLNNGDDPFPQSNFVDVAHPGAEGALLAGGSYVPVHPLENHREHIDVHMKTRELTRQEGAPTDAHDAHIQEHMRYAQQGAQSGNGQNGQQMPMPSNPGSQVAGGVGDPMAKQQAEAQWNQPPQR